MNDIHTTFRNQGLVRPREGRVLGGVVAGLGRRFGIDPWPARLLFVLVLMVIPGSQLLIYPVLWILMPSEDARGARVCAARRAAGRTGPPAALSSGDSAGIRTATVVRVVHSPTDHRRLGQRLSDRSTRDLPRQYGSRHSKSAGR